MRKQEKFICKSCGEIYEGEENKLSIDLDCINPECYETMQRIKETTK